MNFFNKNQIYLKKTNTAFAAADEKDFKPENDAVYTKKDGYYLAERENVRCFVQSRYSVPDEIESIFAAAPKNVQGLILFGCGLGAAVRYALNRQNFPRLKTLIIIEPSPAWASIVLNELDLEKDWGKEAGKISFFVGYRSDGIGAVIANEVLSIKEDFFTVYHLSARALFSEYYRKMAGGMTDRLRNISISINTNKKIMPKRIYNEILNLSLSAYNYVNMMDLFQRKNVIIVAAGPSLEKNINLLGQAKKKAVVVAVGSASRVLDARGIIPHFRVGMDPFPAQHAIYANLRDEPAPLIYAGGFYSEVLSEYQGPLIRVNTEYDNLSLSFHKKKKLPTASFLTGPTVANLAAEIICAAGCKRMVFIGQDMCMYYSRLHADTGESLLNFNDEDMLRLKDICGNDVVAPRNYYMTKAALEKTITRFGGKVDFINATEGGLGLHGVPNQPLADVLAGWEENDIAPLIAERLKKLEPIDFRDELAGFQEQIDEIERLNDENAKNLRKIKEIFLKDKDLAQREKYKQALRAAAQNEQRLKKTDGYVEFIQPALEIFLEAERLQWEKSVDSADEKIRLRSILEIQLMTAQAAKRFTVILTRALKEVFATEVKVKTFSLTAK